MFILKPLDGEKIILPDIDGVGVAGKEASILEKAFDAIEVVEGSVIDTEEAGPIWVNVSDRAIGVVIVERFEATVINVGAAKEIIAEVLIVVVIEVVADLVLKL